MKNVWVCVLACLISLPLLRIDGGDLSREELGRAYKNLKEAMKSRDDRGVADALRDIARDNSKKAVDIIVKVAKKYHGNYEVALGVADGLAMITDERGVKEIVKEAERNRKWEVRILLLQNLVERGESEPVVDALIEALEDKEERVQRYAVRSLARLRVKRAVEPMISLMEELDEEEGARGVLWADLKNCLARMMGKEFDLGASYRGYWEANKDEIDPKTARLEPRTGGSSGGGRRSVTLFGREIHCKRVVFILDVSGSMLEADLGASGRSRTRARTRNRPEEDENQVPEERRRINRAKKELLKVIHGLHNSQHFNIITYSSDVKFWKDEGVHKPTPSNVKSAEEFINSFKAEGVTITDTALRYAFDRVQDADCFYLISDGFATHDGKRKVPTRSITAMVKENNQFRQVQINTLGFEGADVELLEALADLTGGEYSPID